MRPQIIVIQPTRGIIFTEVQTALELELFKNQQVYRAIHLNQVPLPDARNKLVEMALNEDSWTHCLMLDDDNVIPEGGLRALLDLDKDIAFIDYPSHLSSYDQEQNPVYIGISAYQDWKPGESTKGKEVVWSGVGCCLVKRWVLEKMEKPWFEASSYIFRRDNKGHMIITDDQKELESDEQNGGGEDVYFIKKATKLGAKLGMVQDMVSKHLFLEMALPRMATNRYLRSHRIGSKDKITRPMA